MRQHTSITGETRALNPGYPPFRMKAQEAAYYCGMSNSAFLRAVSCGDLPKGLKSTGGRFWLRNELERAMVSGDTALQHDFTQKI
jgi:predicted DNA-binding transcriptional regulator AlpA